MGSRNCRRCRVHELGHSHMSASRGGYAEKSRDHVRIDELELIVDELRRQLGDYRSNEAALIREYDGQVAAVRGEFEEARHAADEDRKQLTDLLHATLERQREFNSQLQDQQLIWDDLDADRAQLEAENQHLTNRNNVLQMQLKAMNEGEGGVGNEKLDQHMRALIADLKDERQWRHEAEQKTDQLLSDRGAAWQLEDVGSRTEQLLEEETLTVNLIEFKDENSRLRSQLVAAQDGVPWEPPVAYSEFDDKDAIQRENRLLKERVEQLEHRSTLRLQLPHTTNYPKTRKPLKPPNRGTGGEQLRKYYDNVPDSLLSRVESITWDSHAADSSTGLDNDIAAELRTTDANASKDYPALDKSPPWVNSHNLHPPMNLPLARKAAEMETETRIALASAKAMARRMLGDDSGCHEYEAIARRLKRQQTDKSGQLSTAANNISKGNNSRHNQQNRSAVRKSADQIFDEADTNEDGVLDRSEFRNAMQTASLSHSRPEPHTRKLAPSSSRGSQLAHKTASAVGRRSSPPRRYQLSQSAGWTKSRSRSPPPHRQSEWRNHMQDRAYPVR